MKIGLPASYIINIILDVLIQLLWQGPLILQTFLDKDVVKCHRVPIAMSFQLYKG